MIYWPVVQHGLSKSGRHEKMSRYRVSEASLTRQRVGLEELGLCLASCHNREFGLKAVLVGNYEFVRS